MLSLSSLQVSRLPFRREFYNCIMLRKGQLNAKGIQYCMNVNVNVCCFFDEKTSNCGIRDSQSPKQNTLPKN